MSEKKNTVEAWVVYLSVIAPTAVFVGGILVGQGFVSGLRVQYQDHLAASSKPFVVTQPSEFTATVTNIVDGDTFDARVDLPFGVSYTDRFRLVAVDTPEMHTVKHTSIEYALGWAAREWVVDWMAGTDYRVVLVTQGRRGSRGRYLTGVRNMSGDDLEEGLIEAGHGEIYVKQ